MTPKCKIFLRSRLTMIIAYSSRNDMVTTTNMSSAAVSCIWARKNARRPGAQAVSEETLQATAELFACHLIAKFLQLSMDTARAPSSIFVAHLKHQPKEFAFDLSGELATVAARSPVEEETPRVPYADSMRLYDLHPLNCSWIGTVQPAPEVPIGRKKQGRSLSLLPPKYRKLMSKCDYLKL